MPNQEELDQPNNKGYILPEDEMDSIPTCNNCGLEMNELKLNDYYHCEDCAILMKDNYEG